MLETYLAQVSEALKRGDITEVQRLVDGQQDQDPVAWRLGRALVQEAVEDEAGFVAEAGVADSLGAVDRGPTAACIVARAWRTAGDVLKARDVLERTIRAQPSVPALSMLARLAMEDFHDPETAEALYRLALEQAPDDAELHIALAHTLTHSDDGVHPALDHLARAMLADPEAMGPVLHALGLLRELGSGLGAMALMHLARRTEDDAPSVNMLLDRALIHTLVLRLRSPHTRPGQSLPGDAAELGEAALKRLVQGLPGQPMTMALAVAHTMAHAGFLEPAQALLGLLDLALLSPRSRAIHHTTRALVLARGRRPDDALKDADLDPQAIASAYEDALREAPGRLDLAVQAAAWHLAEVFPPEPYAVRAARSARVLARIPDAVRAAWSPLARLGDHLRAQLADAQDDPNARDALALLTPSPRVEGWWRAEVLQGTGGLEAIEHLGTLGGPQAVAAFAQAVSDDHADLSNLARAEAALLGGDRDEARAIAAAALHSPDAALCARAHALYAETLASTEDLGELLGSAQDRPEAMRAVWEVLGQRALAQGEHDAANDAFEHALELDPSAYEALRGLGHVHAARDAQAPALDWFAKAMDADPLNVTLMDDVRTMYEESGQALSAWMAIPIVRERFDLGDRSEAMCAMLRLRLLDVISTDLPWRNADLERDMLLGETVTRGLALPEAERAALAWSCITDLEAFDQAAALTRGLDPDALSDTAAGRLHFVLGTLAEADGDLDAAIAHHDAAVQADPHRWDSACNATQHLLERASDSAAEHAQAILDRIPEHIRLARLPLMFNEALLVASAGHFAQARSMLLSIVERGQRQGDAEGTLLADRASTILTELDAMMDTPRA